MRKVTIVATQRNGIVEHNTRATTWGELKKEIASEIGNVNDMVATVGETRNTLGVDNSVLPTGEFRLYLTQAKIKAGAVDMKKVLEDLREGFSDAIGDTLEKLDDGDFDVDSRHENAAVVTGRNSSTKRVSDEDRRMLEELQATLRA